MYLNKLNQNKEFKEKFEKEYEEISYKELWLAFREKHKKHEIFIPYCGLIGSVEDLMDEFVKEWEMEKNLEKFKYWSELTNNYRILLKQSYKEDNSLFWQIRFHTNDLTKPLTQDDQKNLIDILSSIPSVRIKISIEKLINDHIMNIINYYKEGNNE